MPFQATNLKDVWIYKPVVYKDNRGYFFETFREHLWQDKGIAFRCVQENQSFSLYGVVRGLHYQKTPYAQSKLVRVVQGIIQDVAVDLRAHSPDYGKHCSVILSAKNKHQLWIPSGFAHGFCVLSKTATVIYQCDAYYRPESEAGIRFDDPHLNIHWLLPRDQCRCSPKDAQLPLWENQGKA